MNDLNKVFDAATEYRNWYDNVMQVITDEYTDNTERMAALTLLDYAADVKRKIEPRASLARAWFIGRDSPDLSLEAVCALLGLNIYDVRKRLHYMEKHNETACD